MSDRVRVSQFVAPGAFYVLDHDAAELAFGYREEHLPGVEVICHPDDHEAVLALVGNLGEDEDLDTALRALRDERR